MLLLSGYSFTASSSSSSFFSVHEQQHQKRENEADFSIHPFNNLPACLPVFVRAAACLLYAARDACIRQQQQRSER
jgi:hypothetical protein